MIVEMCCYNGRKDKLGGGPQKVEGFILCMTIQMSLIRRGPAGAAAEQCLGKVRWMCGLLELYAGACCLCAARLEVYGQLAMRLWRCERESC